MRPWFGRNIPRPKLLQEKNIFYFFIFTDVKKCIFKPQTSGAVSGQYLNHFVRAVVSQGEMSKSIHGFKSRFELAVEHVGDATRAGAKLQDPEARKLRQSIEEARSDGKSTKGGALIFCEFNCFITWASWRPFPSPVASLWGRRSFPWTRRCSTSPGWTCSYICCHLGAFQFRVLGRRNTLSRKES